MLLIHPQHQPLAVGLRPAISLRRLLQLHNGVRHASCQPRLSLTLHYARLLRLIAIATKRYPAFTPDAFSVASLRKGRVLFQGNAKTARGLSKPKRTFPSGSVGVLNWPASWKAQAGVYGDRNSMASDSELKAFPLGQVVTTRGVHEEVAMEDILTALRRHANCDWGLVCPEDREANEEALRTGSRLLSVYEATCGRRLWVITEADRSVTTVLFPSEY